MLNKVKYLLLVGVLLLVFTIPVHASENERKITDLQINYEQDTGHDNRSKKEIVEELVSEGVSFEDAEFYAKLDILANKMEENGIIINFNEVESYPVDYVAYNMFEIKEKALNLDERAIKSLFESSLVLKHGMEDLKTLTKGKTKNSIGKTVVKYPDGSSVIMNAELQLVEEDDSYKTDTNWPGPWVGTGGGFDMYEQVNINSSGKYYHTNDIEFRGGVYWVKVNDTFAFQIKNNGSNNSSNWSAHFISDSGAASGSGYISVSVDKNNHQGQDAYGCGEFIQGYTDATFTLSGSVEGSVNFWGAGLAVSITAGDFWHQYAITEVAGCGAILNWEAYYK